LFALIAHSNNNVLFNFTQAIMQARIEILVERGYLNFDEKTQIVQYIF
jgi:hypothetical protein